MAFCEAVFDLDVLAFDKARLAQALRNAAMMCADSSGDRVLR